MAGGKAVLKASVRRAVNALGYDIIRFNRNNGRWRLSQLLKRHGITVILDVGANEGSFGSAMREMGYRGNIISFEPLADAFARLQTATRRDSAWKALNIGLGGCDEERVIHVAANSQSSSFLPMLDTHKQAAPESCYMAQQPATIRRLDGIFAELCKPADRIFLKIDTQGFEKYVLEGAKHSLRFTPLVQLECSLVPLYEGDESIEGIISYMRELGYAPIDTIPTFHHRDSFHLMQIDILFYSMLQCDDMG